MTEQEKRENAIEEMARITSMRSCNDNICDLHNDRCAECEATRLYDAGYRKEEEVRKETATEYSNRIDEIVTWCISNKIGDDFDYEYFSNCISNLKKQFGVEVEE